MTRNTDHDVTADEFRDVFALARKITTGRDEDRDAIALAASRMTRDELQTALLVALMFTDLESVDQFEQTLNDKKATA